MQDSVKIAYWNSRLDGLEAKRAGPYGQGLKFDSCVRTLYICGDVMAVVTVAMLNLKKKR